MDGRGQSFRNLDVALSVLSWTDKAKEPIYFELCKSEGAVDSFVEVFMCRLLGNQLRSATPRFGTLSRALKKRGLETDDKFPRPLTELEAFRLFSLFLGLRAQVDQSIGESCESEKAGRHFARMDMLAKLEPQFREYDARCSNSIWRGLLQEQDKNYLWLGRYKEKPRREPDDFDHLALRINEFLFANPAAEGCGPQSQPSPSPRSQDWQDPQPRPYDRSDPSVIEFIRRYWLFIAVSFLSNAIFHLTWGWAILLSFFTYGFVEKMSEEQSALYPIPFGCGRGVGSVLLVASWVLCLWKKEFWPVFVMIGLPLAVLWGNYLLHDLPESRYKARWFLIASLIVLTVPIYKVFISPSKIYVPDKQEVIEEKPVKPDRAHYSEIKRRPAGFCWRNLTAGDLSFLTADDINQLRLQLSNVLNKFMPGLRVTSLSDLKPFSGRRIVGDEKWQANVCLSQDVYTTHDSYMDVASTIDLIPSSVKSYVRNYRAGETVPLRFRVDENSYSISVDGPISFRRNARLLFGDQFDALVRRGNVLLVEYGSDASRQLACIIPHVKELREKMAADNLVKGVDNLAAFRYKSNADTIKGYHNELIRNAKLCRPMSEASPVLSKLLGARNPVAKTSRVDGSSQLTEVECPSGKVRCPACQGKNNTYAQIVCPKCGGSKIFYNKRKRKDPVTACPECKGSGQVLRPEKCRRCGGAGCISAVEEKNGG